MLCIFIYPATASSSIMPSPIVPVALPVLDGSNYSDWKEKLFLSLGCADLDLALRVDKPAAPTDASTANEIAHSENGNAHDLAGRNLFLLGYSCTLWFMHACLGGAAMSLKTFICFFTCSITESV
jgi:hypothetical protein